MRTVDLPPEDRERSPCTGWTRAHWEHVADRMLTAVRPFATDGHALVSLPGPESRSGRWSDGLEGFARTFLLAAFRLAQSADAGHAEWYAAGLAAGSDPGSAERWPRPDEIPQARVEAASIALALHESGLWSQLDDGVRERLVAWLEPMRRAAVPANNWVWFRAVVSAFLRRVGAAWEPRDLEEAAELTERWYAGDGWYTDGGARNFDYYNAWALHFYPLWLARIAGEPPPARYRERLARFLADAQHLVGSDGAPLLQGRSLTYRFAMLAPFWTGAVVGADALSPGRTRRLASGVLRHFLGHGCLDAGGLLPLGWHGAFPGIRQTYSGPGSPYWAAKGFAGLVLPPEHPVWTAAEEPLELERRDVELVVRPAGWLVSGTAADGIVRVANHGTTREPVDWLPGRGAAPARASAPAADDPFYARHAYATHAAPQVTGDPVDSHMALLDASGRPSQRGAIETVAVGRRVAVSRRRAHGGWVTTASALHGPWEVRLARVDAAAGRLRIGGFALAGERVAAGQVRRADGVTSTLTPLRGLAAVDCLLVRGGDPFGDAAWIPVAETSGPAVPGHVHAVLVTLARCEVSRAVALTVRDEAAVEIAWPDGERDHVELGR
jgi:hypothetical protein